MDTLLDFYDRYVRGAADALVYDDGLRRWPYSGDQLRAAAESFCRRLAAAGLQPGDRVVIRGANRPEWVAAFWGCQLRGLTVIPLDQGEPAPSIQRIVTFAGARGLIVDDELPGVLAQPPEFVARFRDIEWPAAMPAPAPRPVISPDDTAEIVFTSGTTGDPKGVLITHRNLVANIVPLEAVAARYRAALMVLRPLRFLVLLPLSHMFGQALAIFLPRLAGAATVFIRGHHPAEIARQIKRHRVTLAAVIPRGLEMMRAFLRPRARSSVQLLPQPAPVLRRWWRHRDVHGLFGWKFLGFVVGGAHLDRELEEYWRGLGFAVIQGYGLTETAPIVALNEPFTMAHGTVGKPLEGLEVRIAADGEVLVRGPAVTPGYLGRSREADAAFEGGWFHTGDIGSLDAAGRLRIHGRKKDEIVTSSGLHVFPEDVEQIIDSIDGVVEAAVIGGGPHRDRVHAVLVLRPGADASAAVREANARLAGHQRIQGFSVWPSPALPRTEALRKLRRHDIARWVTEGVVPGGAPAASRDPLEELLERYAGDHALSAPVPLDELGIGSLDRIELSMAIAERTGGEVSDAAVAACRTVDDLRHLAAAAVDTSAPAATDVFARWASRWPATAIRNASQRTWILPMAGWFLRRRVDGLRHLDSLSGPVLFAANHQSHMDTPAILLSLPPKWRRRVAVTMGREFFDAYFAPARYGFVKRVWIAALYGLAALFFNGIPLPRSGVGAYGTLKYLGELVSNGWSVILYPEGHRTIHGEIMAFQPGVGMMASRLKVPVVPVRLDGVHQVLHQHWRWPRRGPVRIAFGAPIRVEGDDYASLARQIEAAVRALAVTAVSSGEDQVEEASEESFPASDAPSWSGSTALAGALGGVDEPDL
jgi:long-chain acyl-CoA synthetase